MDLLITLYYSYGFVYCFTHIYNLFQNDDDLLETIGDYEAMSRALEVRDKTRPKFDRLMAKMGTVNIIWILLGLFTSYWWMYLVLVANIVIGVAQILMGLKEHVVRFGVVSMVIALIIGCTILYLHFFH